MSPGSAPLYWRILRLRRLRPRPAVTFLLFEGSIVLGILLWFAGIVDGWGIPVVPIAVAVMVKLNDAIAANLELRPLAEAQLRAPRPRDQRPFGVSRVTSAARPTTLIGRDDAVEDPAAWPDKPDVARGVAAVPRRPLPNSQEPETVLPDSSAEALDEDTATPRHTVRPAHPLDDAPELGSQELRSNASEDSVPDADSVTDTGERRGRGNKGRFGS